MSRLFGTDIKVYGKCNVSKHATALYNYVVMYSDNSFERAIGFFWLQSQPSYLQILLQGQFIEFIE